MMENFIYRDPNLYFVGIDGTAPVRFPIDRGVLASFNADGTKMLYCRKGDEEYQWKRYKGGQYQDIWMYDFQGKAFTPISDYVGKNSYPMWIGDRMYFVSDRDNGVSNLYVEELGSKKIQALTRYDKLDVMMPDTDGRRIVYVQDGYLHVFDVAGGSDRKIDVQVQSDRWRLRTRVINPKEYIHDMNVANDGQSALLEARGDLFLLPAGKGQTQEPLRDARQPGALPRPLPGRPVGGLLLRQDRRLPALPAEGLRRRVDAPDHRSWTGRSTTSSGRPTARRSCSATRISPSSSWTSPRRS